MEIGESYQENEYFQEHEIFVMEYINNNYMLISSGTAILHINIMFSKSSVWWLCVCINGLFILSSNDKV